MRLGSPTSLPEFFSGSARRFGRPCKRRDEARGMWGWAHSVGRTSSSLLYKTVEGDARAYRASSVQLIDRSQCNRNLTVTKAQREIRLLNTSGYVLFLMWGIWYALCFLCTGVNDTQTPGLFQLCSTVCELLAIFMRTFYILGSYFNATLIQFGNVIKVALLWFSPTGE